MPDANTVYRDFNIDGNPSSGLHQPVLAEIRDLLTGYEDDIGAIGWPSIAEYGAQVSNTTAQNSTAINAALAFCSTNIIRCVWVPEGTFQCNDDIVNTNGVYFIGPGTIIVGSSGKPISFNATDLNKVVAGMHNLISWHSLLSSASNVALVGDSNTEGGGWLISANSYPDKVLVEYGRQKGYSPHVYNYGVGGTGINDLDLTASWVANTAFGLVIIAYGTNNAAGGIAAYAATLRAKLTTLRAARSGNLGIILKSPATATDTFAPDGTPHLRDERFMRQVHDVHVQMVQEFNVCAVDTFSAYWYMRGSYGGAHMDTLSDSDPAIYRTDAHVHARDVLNTKIWADIMGPVVFPDSPGIYGRNNRAVYYNTLDTDFVPLSTALPATYKNGKSVFPVATAQGWPIAGDCITDRGQFGTVQEIWADGRGYKRFGFTAWGAWSQIVATASTGFTLGTGVTSDAGAPAQVALVAGMLMIKGGFNKSANIAATDVIATSPSGFRPDAQVGVMIATGGGSVAGLWKTNGQIMAQAALTISGATYISIVGSAVAA